MFVCALLFYDKRAEMALNSCMGRLRENNNIDMIYYIHGQPDVVFLRERRYQSMRVCQEVWTFLCRVWPYPVPVCHERCNTAMITLI